MKNDYEQHMILSKRLLEHEIEKGRCKVRLRDRDSEDLPAPGLLLRELLSTILSPLFSLLFLFVLSFRIATFLELPPPPVYWAAAAAP